eukprot:TRINITY_DN9870_c0_g1_i4.p1 TRINITY_DN9870_c0_g1~~TRINITY_DN9870_c0_g1_i4.p1  ORF type:complete len:173 (-),score=6.36 TRINITY_DN9870_c0_g1_i4:149-667(-)
MATPGIPRISKSREKRTRTQAGSSDLVASGRSQQHDSDCGMDQSGMQPGRLCFRKEHPLRHDLRPKPQNDNLTSSEERHPSSDSRFRSGSQEQQTTKVPERTLSCNNERNKPSSKNGLDNSSDEGRQPSSQTKSKSKSDDNTQNQGNTVNTSDEERHGSPDSSLLDLSLIHI